METENISKIFISYRREDSAGYAGRLSEDLTEAFGADRIFMDIVTIEPGADFVDVITKAVSSCEILIVLIGSKWLAVKDETGTRRIDNPDDYVRVEIATALSHHIRVVPVLLQGAQMPREKDLPPPLASLARRNAVELSDHRWSYDVGTLVRKLKKLLLPRKQRLRLTPILVASVLLIVIGWLGYTFSRSTKVKVPDDRNVNRVSTPTPIPTSVSEASLRKRLVPWVDRVFISQAENGGIKVNALDPSSEPQVWATAQCIKGVFASQVSIDKYATQIKSAFNYIETARRNEPEEGWGLFEDRETTITEIAGWVTLAYIESVESRTGIWNSSELPDVLNRIQRDLEHIIQRQSADGGWRPIEADYPGFTRTYSTIMAIWSLVEARRSPVIYKVIGTRYDNHIRRGIMWLLSHYEEKLGWVPNPNRGHQDERFDGLNAQTLFILSRAEKDFGFLETENIYVKAEKDFANHKELSDRPVTLNNRVPDIDSSDFRPTKYQAETTTFLWFPWSFLALTHLSTDMSLSPEERQTAAQLRFKLFESNADQLVRFVERHPVYVLGEVLFCLSHSVN